jgi:hypothetical protein
MLYLLTRPLDPNCFRLENDVILNKNELGSDVLLTAIYR